MDGLSGLIGVVVGSVLSGFRDAWSDRKMRDRHAQYLATRVVCALDSYVEACTEVVADDGLCEGQTNAQGCLEPQVRLPPAPEFSQDLDWQSIDPGLMYRLLSLPNEVGAANRIISSTWDAIGPPDYDFEGRQYQYALLGLVAHALTQELRGKYGLPAQRLGEWNPVDYLTKAKNEIEEDRRLRAAQHSALPAPPPPL